MIVFWTYNPRTITFVLNAPITMSLNVPWINAHQIDSEIFVTHELSETLSPLLDLIRENCACALSTPRTTRLGYLKTFSTHPNNSTITWTITNPNEPLQENSIEERYSSLRKTKLVNIQQLKSAR